MLVSRVGSIQSEIQEAYEAFDGLGEEAEKPWAPLFKAFRLGVSSRMEHEGGCWGKKPSLGRTINLKLGNEKCEFGVGNSLQIGHKCQSLGHLITIKHSKPGQC